MIDFISLMMLTVSIVLSCGRNILSKSVSAFTFGTSEFFRMQTAIFVSGAVGILLCGAGELQMVSTQTLIYSIVYGGLLLSAQWCYTASLKTGATSVCATVYSLGFIFPALSGAIFFNEEFGISESLGIVLAITAVIFSGIRSKKEEAAVVSKKYMLPLVIAMLSSGGLGIVQKLQQNSACHEQRIMFVLIAFCIASAVSLIMSVFAKPADMKSSASGIIRACGTGMCFGCCNVLNTILAGRLDSMIFFPVQNICVILLSMIMGMIVFAEKPGKKEFIVILLGIGTVLLLSA